MGSKRVFHKSKVITWIFVKVKSKTSILSLLKNFWKIAKEVAKWVNINVSVNPTSHEARISEIIKHFIKPMVVDIRPGEDKKFGDSKNYYFYQNNEGQIVFCLTPNPPIYGLDRKETSQYLPQIAKRIIFYAFFKINLRIIINCPYSKKSTPHPFFRVLFKEPD